MTPLEARLALLEARGDKYSLHRARRICRQAGVEFPPWAAKLPVRAKRPATPLQIDPTAKPISSRDRDEIDEMRARLRDDETRIWNAAAARHARAKGNRRHQVERGTFRAIVPAAQTFDGDIRRS